MNIKMTLRHLQIFQTVCECKSITVAAERLNITQPSVSIAVKELEAFYQTKLFDRVNRKIYLTEEGNVLQQYTDALLGQYEESISVLRNGKMRTRCRLGVNVSVAETFLAQIVRIMNTQMPNMTLKVCIQNNEQIDRLLTDNQIDFAIYDKIDDRESKVSLPLLQDNIVVCCSAACCYEDSLTLEQLSKKPLLLREKGSGMRSCIDYEFLKRSYPQNIVAESTSTLGLIELAQAGLGYALVPQSLAKKLLPNYSIRLLSIEGVFLSKSYHLAYDRRKFMNPALKAAMEVLLSLRN